MLQYKCLFPNKNASGIFIWLDLAVRLVVSCKMICDPLNLKSLRSSWMQLLKEESAPTTRSLDTGYTENKTACFLLGE